MDLLEAIKGRRSVRSFKKQNIPQNAIEILIDSARNAPSAGNIQPWEFVIITNSTTKRKLAEATLNQKLIEEAPMTIVVCADEKRSAMGYGERGKTLFCLQDTAAATQNILLTAYAMGLATCWIGAFKEDEVKDLLKASEGIRPVAIIPIGYPNETVRQRGKRLLNQMVHYERF